MARDLIFISYRRQAGSRSAIRLRDTLGLLFGDDRVFVDSDAVPGPDYPLVLREQLSRSDVLIVCIDEGWLSAADELGRRRLDVDGDWVREEIEHGLAAHDCIVIPVTVDGAVLPGSATLPESIIGLSDATQAINIDHASWPTDFGTLTNALAERVLARRGARLGELHPLTLSARKDLADSYFSTSRLFEAIDLYEQVLAGRAEVLGQLHLDTLAVCSDLAFAYMAVWRDDEGLALQKRLLAGRVHVLGTSHAMTLNARENLVEMYRMVDNDDAADRLSR